MEQKQLIAITAIGAATAEALDIATTIYGVSFLPVEESTVAVNAVASSLGIIGAIALIASLKITLFIALGVPAYRLKPFQPSDTWNRHNIIYLVSLGVFFAFIVASSYAVISNILLIWRLS